MTSEWWICNCVIKRMKITIGNSIYDNKNVLYLLQLVVYTLLDTPETNENPMNTSNTICIKVKSKQQGRRRRRKKKTSSNNHALFQPRNLVHLLNVWVVHDLWVILLTIGPSMSFVSFRPRSFSVS